MNKLFILVGPSAAGKTLISNFLVHKDVNFLQNLINVVNDLDKSSMLENLNIAINGLLYKYELIYNENIFKVGREYYDQ